MTPRLLTDVAGLIVKTDLDLYFLELDESF